MHGNVLEWCQELAGRQQALSVRQRPFRILRAGAPCLKIAGVARQPVYSRTRYVPTRRRFSYCCRSAVIASPLSTFHVYLVQARIRISSDRRATGLGNGFGLCRDWKAAMAIVMAMTSDHVSELAGWDYMAQLSYGKTEIYGGRWRSSPPRQTTTSSVNTWDGTPIPPMASTAAG